MQKAKLILDELDFSNLVFDVKGNLDRLEGIISAAESADPEVMEVFGINDERFYSLESGGRNVSEELFSERNGECRDFVVRLQIQVSKWSPLREMEREGEGSGISILKANGCGALLAITRPGLSPWWDDAKMHLVSRPEDIPGALRKHFLVDKIEQKYFSLFCPRMFPDLYFYASPDKIKNLGVSYFENVRAIVSYFSYLNDFASDHFDADEDRVIIAMAASMGVVISPESPKTRRNTDAMEERDIEINGEKLRCEWHAKITPEYGRIHFYARKGRPEKVRSEIGIKVVVGILTDHLKI
ncbi:hypothetical protein [Burkholderia gladioli]|uniref:hypothetical protein n=1 Tax=Burkholderia gladioli TaxID=28095 RepID=UPI00163EF6F9|nr:hypothetical protein [Burkholderia gladioli]